MSKPDILVCMSDQHNAQCIGYAGDPIVRTPNLDRLASEGTTFQAAYTPYPQCVPARMSWLTGHLPSTTGICTNLGALPPDYPTFAHSFAAAGYETVLCGRMHFMGDDQRHGFSKRLVGDLSSLYWGRDSGTRKELGAYAGTLGRGGSCRVVGGGTSPVLEYDRAVFESAVEYLTMEHDKPQLVVVGVMAPHSTYVAPPELYRYYRDIVTLPPSRTHEVNHANPFVKRRANPQDEKTTLDVRAAYYGMVENLDNQIGSLVDAWSGYLKRSGRQGVFVYVSDHGDQIGHHDLYAKHTFFEGSARVPLLYWGDGVARGRTVCEPVTLMDQGNTLCVLASCEPPPFQEGRSHADLVAGGESDPARRIISEYVDSDENGEPVPARMVRCGSWKLIHYHGHEDHDQLFNIDEDPFELQNRLSAYPAKVEELRTWMDHGWDVERIKQDHRRKSVQHKHMAQWGARSGAFEDELWQTPASATVPPVVR